MPALRDGRILLIGGGGFLGSHFRRLMSRLGRRGCIVVSRATIPLGKDEIWMPSAALLEGRKQALEAIAECSAVVYAATTSIPNRNEASPWIELGDNVSPALHLFEQIGQSGKSLRVVLLSSGGTVYGDIGSHSAVTEDTPAAPVTAYAFGSHLVEQALQFAHRRYGFPYSILRIANPVGIYQGANGQGLVPAILRAIRNETPVPVFGDGHHVRDYFDADDLSHAILLAASDGASRSHIWNVGSGVGRSVMEMIDLTRTATGRAVSVEHLPPRATDIGRLVLDCSKIRRELGWSTEIDLSRTIAGMWSESATPMGATPS